MFGSLRLPRDCGGSDARSLWHAHLCASCHAMHEVGGRPTSLLTNYDQTLLALVLAGLAPPSAVEARACTAVPWRRVAVQPLPPVLRAFLAAGNLVLIEAKLRDDVADERRVTARLGLWLLRRKFAAARARMQALGFPLSMVTGLPEQQHRAERHGWADLAAFAAPSAELLAQVFVHGGLLAGGSDRSDELANLGALIGRAVYVFDAIVDHDEDLRRHRFNALVATAGAGELAPVLVQASAMLANDVRVACDLATRLLPSARAELIGSVLRHLGARGEAAVRRLESPARSESRLRPAEAGDCDLPCDACCDGGGCLHCGTDAPPSCGCDCCWPGSGERRRNSEVIGRTAKSAEGNAREAVRDLSMLIGKKARTMTIVDVSGRVAIDGANYDAFTAGSYLPSNTQVIVREVCSGRLRVERITGS